MLKKFLGKYVTMLFLETEIDNDVFKQVIRFKRELDMKVLIFRRYYRTPSKVGNNSK